MGVYNYIYIITIINFELSVSYINLNNSSLIDFIIPLAF